MESALYREVFQKWEARGDSRGTTRTKAETVVRVLAYRLGTLAPEIRERIVSQTVPEILDLWYNEALLATTAEDARRLAEKIRQAPTPEVGS